MHLTLEARARQPYDKEEMQLDVLHKFLRVRISKEKA